MKSFLAGLGIGVGLGLLFAPLTGEETRSRISQRAGDLADSAHDLMEQGRERVQDTVSRLREKAADIRRGRHTGTESIRDL